METKLRWIIAVSLLFMSSSAVAQVCGYGIYSTQQTNIRDRVQLSPGAVGSAAYVEVGVEAKVNGDIVSAGNVFLRDRCTVNANVYAAGSILKQNQVVVTGGEYPNVAVAPEIIETKTVTPGTQNFNLYNGNHLDLAPGAYRDMHLYDGSSLTLHEGVYSFRTFIMEAGNAALNFNPDDGFIEVNVSGELRFGDRNQFVLAGEADPVQVQFYTNGTNQVKVGTDSTFNGVITAPNAQVYVFSRVTVNGALYGKQVWVDADSKVNFYPNCTAYNTDMDDSATVAMCNALSFEELAWTPISGGENSEVALADEDYSDGSTSLEVALYSDPYIDLEAQMDVTMPFSENATTVTAKLDVLSNAAPYATWGGEISLYLMGPEDEEYAYAGTFIYDPADPFTETFETLETNLPQDYADLLLAGAPVSVVLSISATQSDAVFWIDHLQFCDENGACNLACSPLLPEDYIPGEEVDRLISGSWSDEDNEMMTGQSSLSGIIANVSGVDAIVRLVLEVHSAMGQTITVPISDLTLAQGASSSFSVPASALPFNTPGFIGSARIHTIVKHGDTWDDDISPDWSAPRYYRHNADGTIDHFSEAVFVELFEEYSFRVADGVAPVNIIDDGEIAGQLFSERFGSAEFDESLWDTDEDTDTDPVIILE